MALDYDIYDQMMKMTKESIETLSAKVENLSPGMKKMYLAERARDLQTVNNSAYCQSVDSLKEVDSKFSSKKIDVDFFGLIEEIKKESEEY